METLFSGISRGTETLVFQHRVPPSQYAAMRCPFQEGEFPAPVKYGYSVVGRVVDGPENLLGRVVFVLHPHQTRFVVPATAAVPIPPEVPPGRAVLAANMETALNGLWDAEVIAGDRVCVIGAGVVGPACGLARGRHPGRLRTADRHGSGEGDSRRGTGATVSKGRRGRGRLRDHRARQRQSRGPAHGPGDSRVRGTDHRDELVRRPRGLAAVGRGIPLPPAQHPLLAGRDGRRLAPRTLDAPAAARAGAAAAGRRSPRCADLRREPVRVAARGHA